MSLLLRWQLANLPKSYLPAAITDLHLEQFAAHPNKWMEPPLVQGEEESGPSCRVLSPKPAKESETVPRLTSLCLSVLLSPRPPTGKPPFLDLDWDNFRRGRSHPLLDVDTLAELIPPSLRDKGLSRILQAVRSACASAGKGAASADFFPRSNEVLPPDNASENPYYCPCPSPKHQEWQQGDNEGVRVARRIFLDPAEERFEWVTIAGVPNLPIQWLGCSPGCLDFLEEDEGDDEWLEHFGE